jgi:hypothetical protein
MKLEMRSGKFWHPMMYFIVESSLANAWILYKATRELAGLPLQYDHFQFRVSIALSLAAEWEGMGCVFNPVGQVNSPTKLLQNLSAKKVRVSFGTRNQSRWSSNDNHLSNLIDIPLLEGQKTARRRQLYCIQDDCNSRTTKMCRACRAPLCFPGCYLAYHNKSVTK